MKLRLSNVRASLKFGGKIALAFALLAIPLWAQSAPDFPVHTPANFSLTTAGIPFVATLGNCAWVGAHFDLGTIPVYCPSNMVSSQYINSLAYVGINGNGAGVNTYYEWGWGFCVANGILDCSDIFLTVNRDYYVAPSSLWSLADAFDMGENTSTGNIAITQAVHGAFRYHASAYTDNTCPLYGDGVHCTTPVSLVSGDKQYFGYFQPYDQINVVLATPASGATVLWEYSTGSGGWATLTVTDGTASLTANGQVKFIPPSGWRRDVVSGSKSKYFVRLTITGSGVTFTSVRGDNLLSSSPCTDCGTGHNATGRGWSASAWSAGAALTVDGQPYNATPPNSCPSTLANVCATARFPYQGWGQLYGGDHNEIWPNPDVYNGSVTPANNIMALQLAYKVALPGAIPAGYTGVSFDNVGAISGAGAPTPPISTLINFMPFHCAPSCSISTLLNNEGSGSSYGYTPSFNEATNLIHAETPPGFVVLMNANPNPGSTLAMSGDTSNNEFYLRGVYEPNQMSFQSADDMTSTNNTRGSVRYFQFIDSGRWQLQDTWGVYHQNDDGDRAPMIALGEFYMMQPWCGALGNCWNNTYNYQFGGFTWGTSVNASYNWTAEVAKYTTASGTLALPLGPVAAGTSFTMMLTSDSNVQSVGGNYYATLYEFQLCLAADTLFQHCDKFPATKTSPNNYASSNVPGAYVPILGTYPAGSGTVVRFATTVTINSAPMPSWHDIWMDWAIWWPAIGFNLGKPDASGLNHGVRTCGSDCASTFLPSPPGPFMLGSAITCVGHAGSNGCPSDAPASCSHAGPFGNLWRRDFTGGVVLVRNFGYHFCPEDYDIPSQNIDLTSLQSSCASSCSYYVLHADGTTTGPVTSINLRAAEAAVLVPNPAGTLSIVTSSLPGGFLGVAYSQPVTATGGTPPYSWTVSSGSLCTGLSLSLTGTPSATVSGNPTHVQTCSFTVQVTDSLSATATQPLSITIVGYGPLVITTPPCPGGTIFVAYGGCTQTYAGGNGHNTWSVLSGSLPAGLAMSSSTGAITGTPTASGAFSFTTQATDTETPPQVATQPQTITIAGTGSLIIVTASLPNGTVGVPYSQTLTATGGTPPYTWSVLSGTFPASLGLSSGGTVSGTPSHAGSSPAPVTVKVTDSLAATNFHPYTLLINPARGATGSQGEISLGEILH
jgi:hypothetical protein